LKYPYNEEELKDTKKWKDNALKGEIIKLRSYINKLDIESNEFDTLSTELAKLEKEAENRGLFLSAEEKEKKDRMSLDNLKDIDWWRDKCLNDLYFLCRVVLQTLEQPTPGYKDLYKPTHKHITTFVQENAKPEQRLLILCPRGWVKTYIITIGYTIQRILRNLVNKSGDTVLISNATFTNAQMFLNKIKYNFQYNELLCRFFLRITKRTR